MKIVLPSPSMGEGVGGGEDLNLYPPYLNPLPPGERRYLYVSPMFELIFTPQAHSDLREIEKDPGKKDILKAVRKTLGFMETNLRRP